MSLRTPLIAALLLAHSTITLPAATRRIMPFVQRTALLARASVPLSIAGQKNLVPCHTDRIPACVSELSGKLIEALTSTSSNLLLKIKRREDAENIIQSLRLTEKHLADGARADMPAHHSQRPLYTTESRNTPLHVAATRNMIFLDALLEGRRFYGNIDPLNKYQEIPLHFAASHGAIEHVIALCSHGANPNARDDIGRTPCMNAIGRENENENIADFLVDLQPDVHGADARGQTLLHIATFHGRPALVRKLLKLGADPKKRNHDGETPIDINESEWRDYIALQRHQERYQQEWARSYYRQINACAAIAHIFAHA